MNIDQLQSERAALEGRLRIDFPASDDVMIDERWKRAFHDLTPRQVYERFAAAGGEGNEVKVKITLPAYDRLATIEVRHNTEWTDSEYKNALIFKVNNESASMERSFLLPKDQGRHLVKRYLGAAVDLLRKMGVETLTTRTEQVGGYAWAKYGFVPADAYTWENFKSAMTSAVRGNFLVFKGEDYDVTLERPLIRRFLAMDFSELADSFCDLVSGLNRKIGEVNGKRLNVGMALLMNTTWDGILRLDDNDKNFQRFKRYTSEERRLELV